jgi:predicted nucleic acid-binding Zn ribbon protein
MRRNETRNISDLLNDFKKESQYSNKLAETQLIGNWSKLLGPVVEKGTRNLYISNRTLFVFIDSSVMRHELFMIRSQILAALNKSVGTKVIDNIIFR